MARVRVLLQVNDKSPVQVAVVTLRDPEVADLEVAETLRAVAAEFESAPESMPLWWPS